MAVKEKEKTLIDCEAAAPVASSLQFLQQMQPEQAAQLCPGGDDDDSRVMGRRTALTGVDCPL